MDHLEELSDTKLLDLRDDWSKQHKTLLKDLNDHMRKDLEEEAKHKFAKRLTKTHFDHIDHCKNCIFDINNRMKDCSSRRQQSHDKAMKCISELRHVQDEIEEVNMELRVRNARNSCETVCPWLAPPVIVHERSKRS